MVTISVALVVAIIFGVISFWQYEKATVAAKAANDARDQADGLINFMLYDLRDKLGPIGRLDVLDDMANFLRQF